MSHNSMFKQQARKMLKEQRLSVAKMLDRWPTRSAPSPSSLATMLRAHLCPTDGEKPATWGPWS